MTLVASTWGPLVTEVDVDQAMLRTLRLWLPSYLTRVEKERHDVLEPNALARPKPESYANTLEDDEFLDHTLPAVIVTTAQLDDAAMYSDGLYAGGFKCRVSCIVRGRNAPESRAVAALFGGCVRRVLVQQPSLGGFANGTRLLSGLVSPVDDVTPDGGRWLAAAINDFSVTVDEVVQAGVGPLEPDDPYDPLASVDAVNVSVVGRPIKEN